MLCTRVQHQRRCHCRLWCGLLIYMHSATHSLALRCHRTALARDAPELLIVFVTEVLVIVARSARLRNEAGSSSKSRRL